MDDEFWARVRGLVGSSLETARWRRFTVVDADARGLHVLGHGASYPVRITRRTLEAAAPFVAAGRPLPAKFRSQAGRLTAILHAAGLGPDA